MKSLLVATAVAFCIAGISVPAKSFETWNRTCAKLAKNWDAKPRHKAIAISTDSSGESCGLAWGQPSVKAAEQGALKWCRKSAQGAPCHVVRSD